MEGNASVFGMYSPIVPKKKIASYESTSTLEAFEWAFLGICGEMSVRQPKWPLAKMNQLATLNNGKRISRT